MTGRRTHRRGWWRCESPGGGGHLVVLANGVGGCVHRHLVRGHGRGPCRARAGLTRRVVRPAVYYLTPGAQRPGWHTGVNPSMAKIALTVALKRDNGTQIGSSLSSGDKATFSEAKAAVDAVLAGRVATATTDLQELQDAQNALNS